MQELLHEFNEYLTGRTSGNLGGKVNRVCTVMDKAERANL